MTGGSSRGDGVYDATQNGDGISVTGGMAGIHVANSGLGDGPGTVDDILKRTVTGHGAGRTRPCIWSAAASSTEAKSWSTRGTRAIRTASAA